MRGKLLKTFIVITVMLISLQIGFAAPADGILSYWDLEENTGSNAIDWNSTNDLPITNGAYVATTPGTCGDYSINLTAGYLTNGSVAHMQISQFTVNMWVNFSNSAQYYGLAGMKKAQVPQNNYGWFISTRSGDGGVNFNTFDGTNNPGAYFDNESIFDNEWHMITGYVDATNITLFHNGQRYHSVSNTATLSLLPSFTVGAHPFLSQPMTGQISHVMYWSRPLSASEIMSIYENESTGTCFDTENADWLSNFAPNITSITISNSPPIYSSDVLNAQFSVDDTNDDNLTINLTWFKSTDNATWTLHTTDNETWTDQTNDTYTGATYNSGTDGDIEATDTTAFEYWIAQLTVTDGTVTVSQNSTEVFINNNVPNITATYINSSAADIPYGHGDVIKINGYSGSAVYFDGVDDSVYYQDVTTFSDFNNTSFSMGGWVNISSGDSFIIANNGVGASQGYNLQFTQNKFLCKVVDTSSTVFTLYANDYPGMNNSEYHHAFCVIDRDANLMSIYLNGTSVNSTDISSMANVSPNSYLSIGADLLLFNELQGEIDELYMFERALTADNVSDLYSNTLTHTQTDFAQSWFTAAYFNSTGEVADFGDDILFTVQGLDADDDTVTLKICYNNPNNWTDCNQICNQSTPVTFDNVNEANISCTYTTNDTTRNNEAYGIIYDGGNFTTSSVITYAVNQIPSLSGFEMQDTSADTTYYFGESIDYFKINWSDADSLQFEVIPNITVKDPDGVVKVSNQQMNYTTDLYLDAIGNWSVNITYTDNDGYLVFYNTTFEVLVNTLSTGGRIFGYDFEDLPTFDTVNTSSTTYNYYIHEIRINATDTWSDVSTLIQQMKNSSLVATLTLETDLSSIQTDLDYVNDNFADLIDGNHLNAMRHLKIYVADGVTENATNSVLLNNLTKRMFQNVSNKFPIFIRNYNHSDVNLNYATIDSYIYITFDNASQMVDTEIGYLRNTTDRSRYYHSLSNDMKAQSFTWQDTIINKMRAALNISTAYTETNVAELNNGDIIVTNNGTTSQTYEITTIGITAPNAYVLTDKILLNDNASAAINVTVSAGKGVMVYFANFTKIQVEDDDDMFLYGSLSSSFNTNTDWSGNTTNAFQFVSSSANPDDARIILTDPSYVLPDFYVWYGAAGAEAVSNLTMYDRIIIGQGNEVNTSWVENLANNTNMYGYVAVSDYGNNNYPAGCTPGVDCTDWNRTAWLVELKSDISNWTDIDNDVNIFIDGLDIGAVNDVDSLFGDALTELTDYVQITKQREVILNTYTSYEDYATLGDYTMRESVCGRWNGTASSPTYEYEQISLEVERAAYHKRHDTTLLAQVFGAITDYDKAYYCYMQTKVLYGDLAEISYNQPTFEYTGAADDFQWNYFKYPDVGLELEEEYTTIGTDSYRRRFENGIVTVNTTAKTVEFANNQKINQVEFCSYFYDNDDGVNDEGYMHFVINDNLSAAFNITDDDLTAFSKTYKCANLTTHYQPSGFYEIEFYYIDSDATYLNNDGLFMYHGVQTGSDRNSFWDQTLNDHPSNDETDYTFYGTGDNWAVNFTIDKSLNETAIDEVTSVITRAVSGVEKVNVTFSATNTWNISVYDKAQVINKTRFNGVYVGSTLLNMSTTNCNTNSPTYNTSSVDGYTWQACKYNETVGSHYIKVVAPYIGPVSYLIDGNTPPTISTENITLTSLNGSNQTWTFNFSYADADSNNVTTCRVIINGTTYSGFPSGGSCSLNTSIALNGSVQTAILSVLDEYSTPSEENTSYNLATIVYDKIESSPRVSNLTVQYFLKYWNVSQTNGNFTDINFSYDGLDSRIINITNGTTRDFLNYSTNVITYGEFDYVADGANAYVVDQGETVFRYFNISGNLTTGEQVPKINLTLAMTQYVSGTQNVKYECGTYNDYDNFSTGSTFTVGANVTANGSTECYEYLYNGKVIYTESELDYTQNGTTRNYFWNNTDGNDYGAKIDFMFETLRNTSINLTYNFAYSDLPNWAARTASAKDVYRYDSPSTYTEETINSDYTYVDNTGSEVVTFAWAATNAPFTNLFVNLTYSAEVVTYQCSDGIDNDGDGDIDYPADAGCTGTTDDTENSETPVASGGGGGGGSTVVVSSTTGAFTISPSLETYRTSDGTKRNGEFSINNKDSQKLTFKVAVEEGIDDNLSNDASGWIVFENGDDSFSLSIDSAGGLGSSIKFVQYIIEVPEGTPFGEYDARIKVSVGSDVAYHNIKIIVGAGAFDDIIAFLTLPLIKLGEFCTGEELSVTGDLSTTETSEDGLYCPESDKFILAINPLILIIIGIIVLVIALNWKTLKSGRRKKK